MDALGKQAAAIQPLSLRVCVLWRSKEPLAYLETRKARLRGNSVVEGPSQQLPEHAMQQLPPMHLVMVERETSRFGGTSQYATTFVFKMELMGVPIRVNLSCRPWPEHHGRPGGGLTWVQVHCV